MDRIDLHVEVPNLPHTDLVAASAGESSDAIRQRCVLARQRAMDRQGSSNMDLQGQAIDQHIQLDGDALKFLNVAASRLGWSARGTHRALKVARTIADLAGAQQTQVAHLAEAMQYRRTLSQ